MMNLIKMVLSLSWLTILVAAVSTLGGYFYASRTLRKQKAQQSTGEAVLQWEERPKASILADPSGALLIYIQALILLSLGAILVYTTSQPYEPLIPESFTNRQLDLLTEAVRLGSVAVLFFYFVGSLLFLVLRTFQRHRYAVVISSDGVGYDSIFLSWDSFSHFTWEEKTHTINLHSRFCPSLITIKLNLETGELKVRSVTMLKSNLPVFPQSKQSSFIHHKWSLYLSILLASFLALAANLFLSNHSAPWSWFAQLVVAYTFFLLCGKIIRLYLSFPSSKGNITG